LRYPRLLALSVLLFLVAATSAGMADTLFCNGTACGTVTTSQEASGVVEVNITMTGGFQLQSDSANTVRFEIPSISSGGTATVSDISLNGGAESGSFSLTAGSHNEGNFLLNFQFGQVGNLILTSISFDVTAADVLASNITGVAVHYCSPGPDKCPEPTGFATTGPSPGAVPEPGTMVLFGSGLLGVAGVVRRRLVA